MRVGDTNEDENAHQNKDAQGMCRVIGWILVVLRTPAIAISALQKRSIGHHGFTSLSWN